MECDTQKAEIEKRSDVENRWKKRVDWLEEEVGKLKKEAADFYSADRFEWEKYDDYW